MFLFSQEWDCWGIWVSVYLYFAKLFNMHDHFAFLEAVCMTSSCFIFSSTFGIVSFSNFSHSNRNVFFVLLCFSDDQ